MARPTSFYPLRDGFIVMGSSEQGRKPKIERISEKYGIDDLGHELEERWLASGDDHMSLRELADYVNVKILKSTVNNEWPRPQEFSHIYSVLTSNDISPEKFEELRKNLTMLGIDVDDIKADFVSHQAVHSYLRNYRNVEYEREQRSIEEDLETVHRIRSQLINITGSIIKKHRLKNDFNGDTYDINVDIQIHCKECDYSSSVEQYLENKGCECQQSMENTSMVREF